MKSFKEFSVGQSNIFSKHNKGPSRPGKLLSKIKNKKVEGSNRVFGKIRGLPTSINIRKARAGNVKVDLVWGQQRIDLSILEPKTKDINFVLKMKKVDVEKLVDLANHLGVL